MPYILRTIVQDATVYFFVIFTSHFVVEMFLLFVNVGVFTRVVSAFLIIYSARFAALAEYVSAGRDTYRGKYTQRFLYIGS